MNIWMMCRIYPQRLRFSWSRFRRWPRASFIARRAGVATTLVYRCEESQPRRDIPTQRPARKTGSLPSRTRPARGSSNSITMPIAALSSSPRDTPTRRWLCSEEVRPSDMTEAATAHTFRFKAKKSAAGTPWRFDARKSLGTRRHAGARRYCGGGKGKTDGFTSFERH